MFPILKSVFLFIFLTHFAKANVEWFLSDKKSPQKWAFVPVYEKTGTLGHVVGGRVFIYPTEKKGYYLSLNSKWSPQKNNNLSFKTNAIFWGENDSEILFQAHTGTFFDPLYTENSLKRVEAPSQKLWIKNHILFGWRGPVQTGTLMEFRLRQELSKPCFSVVQEKTIQMKEPCALFSNREIGLALGMILRSDTRDKMFNPKKGYLHHLEIKGGYDFANKGPLFLQTEVRLRHIFSILEDERWIFTLAVGGSLFNKNKAFSHLPYSWQFKLGGKDRLRGYQMGRFHGDHYYLAQSELRWPLLKWLKPLIFIDLGHVDFFSKPYWTYGLGFLLGIPSSYDKKIRFEMGWALDQANFVVAFEQPY